MIVDANILLYAIDAESPQRDRAAEWLNEHLNGGVRIGLPWESLTAFLRIATHPGLLNAPLSPEVAVEEVDRWLAAPAAWVPTPREDHARVFSSLLRRYRCAGRVVPDAHLATLALTHGVAIASADTDFARFSEVRWVNPLA